MTGSGTRGRHAPSDAHAGAAGPRPTRQAAGPRPTRQAAGSLAEAVEAGLAGAGQATLSAGVQRLMTAYRSGEVPDAPVMASRQDAAAYAAYRMPATAAAAAAALRQVRLALPGWAPATLLDFGAGTGSMAWAAVAELPSLESVTLLEQSAEAIRLGRAIIGQSPAEALRTARWQPWRLRAADEAGPRARQPARSRPSGQPGGPADLPAVDLATSAYVLGELTEPQQVSLIALTIAVAPAVLLIEPGTPAGHRRILAARAALLAAGYELAAPCPHAADCPLAAAGDWCHFAARVQRSAVHRRAKGVELSYEDEKFSYVAALRPELRSTVAPAGLPGVARVVRRPQQRKGLVMLELCTLDGRSQRELVSKIQGEAYRRARKTSWGDRWEAS
ncbi:MAG TPA: small ribosomal subunit Rsm22 family protein [Streptosporangiaceae bacterium]